MNPIWEEVAKILANTKRRRGPRMSLSAYNRIEKMTELYLSGQTLEQIGEAYSMTRERVRQILRKAGVAPELGGHKMAKSRKMQMQRVASKAKKEARLQRIFGCGKEEFDRLNDGHDERYKSSKSAGYFSQMRFAEQRGIEWKITFPEWCAVWDQSGHFASRGRGADNYCMSRLNDKGPYSKDNVRIVTNRQNIQDGFETRALPYSDLNLRKWRVLAMREQGISYETIMKEMGTKKQTTISWACDARRWRKEGKRPPNA